MVLPDSQPAQLPTLPEFAPPTDVDASAVATAFLDQVEKAISARDAPVFQSLFTQWGYWRDVLSFTGEFHTFKTAQIGAAAKDIFTDTQAKDFKLVESPKASIQSPFPDLAFLRFHYTFTADLGPGCGVASLVYDNKSWKAWTFYTSLNGVHGVPQRVGDERPYGRHNDIMSYDARRAMETAAGSGDPDLVVIGAGHNGLAVAAMAKSYGLEPLVIDKEERVGDNWRKRYASLSLHDPVVNNHLPLMPFPRTWPLFTPAGKLANWLETYVDVMELNVWLRSTTDPARTRFNEDTKTWEITVLQTMDDGTLEERLIKTSHVVLATGLGGGKPKMPPTFPGQDSWSGTIVHSSKHPGGAGLEGKKVLVVGSCTSAFDISADLSNNGVDVTMLQRSPTFVMSLKNGIRIIGGGVYNNTLPVEVADEISAGMPRGVMKLFTQRSTAWLKSVDKDMIDGLTKAGFKTFYGPEASGVAFSALEKGGGYYFDTGTCQMIADGKIAIKQGEIASFDTGSTIRFNDGSEEVYDYVVFATGYTGYKDSVREVLGDGPAEKLTQIFGLDQEGEMNGIARDCGIPQMFFNVGNLASSRMFSKAIALQIIAQKKGVWKKPYYLPKKA